MGEEPPPLRTARHADLARARAGQHDRGRALGRAGGRARLLGVAIPPLRHRLSMVLVRRRVRDRRCRLLCVPPLGAPRPLVLGEPRYPPFERSEEHTSELQSLMRISYAVFCLKKKTI